MQTDAAKPKGAKNSHLLCEASRSGRAHACGRRPHPPRQLTGARRRGAPPVRRTAGGSRAVARASTPVARLSARAIAIAVDPQDMCGATT
jgi:hypothetical protein